ncbi:MAG: hypothetical protein EXR86_12030 [Gammaproteobacteria bacterium]|nr:hypothetical protein [Gammaproteobacteria bacterium]
MYFLDILLNSQLLVAMLIFGVLAALEPFLETWIERAFVDNAAALWSWEHFGVPFVRAALALGFVYCAYPALFGLREAPSIATLLAAEDARTSTALGALYVLALLSPVLPIFYSHPEFVLPIQGILGTAFLFKWMSSYLLIPAIGLWPGLDFACVIVLTAYLAHRIARRMGVAIGGTVDQFGERRGSDALLTHVITLQVQLPVIVLYAAGLGRQLAI